MKLYYSQKLKISKIRKRAKKRNIFLSIILFIIILTLSYFVFLSDNFKIEYFDLEEFLEEGRERELSSEFDKFRNDNYLSNNLIFSSEKIFQNFFNRYPFVKEFSLDKNWKTKSIDFKIEKRNIFGILCQNEFKNCLVFDKFGFLFSDKTENYELNKKIENIEFKIFDSSGRLYELESNILDFDNFSKLLEIYELLNQNIKVKQIEMDEEGLNFVFQNDSLFQDNFLFQNNFVFQDNFEKKWRIILDIDNLEISFVALKNLFLGEFDFNNLQYLDLRYLPNMYFKRNKDLETD